MAVRTWILAVLVALVAMMVSCVALVGGLTYLVVQRVHIDPAATERNATREIEAVQERFDGQAPLISLDVDSDTLRDRLREKANSYSGPLPTSLYVMVWNAHEEKLVRFSLPLWLLKLKAGPIDINAGDFHMHDLRVTAEDIERAGPAIVLDIHEDDTRVLVWTQ
jgi:hypothetical protein